MPKLAFNHPSNKIIWLNEINDIALQRNKRLFVMNCEECTKEVTQTPGKRTKRFCNSTCRSNHWQKQKVLEKNAVNTIEELKPILPQKKSSQPGVDFIEKHPLWKDRDPKENSMGFFLKYNCYTYAELQEKISKK